MSEDTLLKVEALSRLYGPHLAVDHLDFQIRRGEVLGFLGPNGAGKSTTMRMLTGNLAPSHGRILINGIDILDRPKAAKAHMGYLPEQPPLYRELSVDEYLRFCARINGVARSQVAKAVDSAKQRCGLSQVGKRLIANLSKGYQQRAGIAQAIIHGPDLVILDEPTVGLDPIQIREIRGLIRELGGEHSVILSSHILPEIQSTCDRVQIINQGRLVLSDSIQGLSQRMRTSSLVLGLRHMPALSELEAVPGIEAVEPLDDQRVRVRHAPDASPAEALAQLAVEKQWGLQELSPEQRSLEEIFVDITTSEDNSEESSEETEAGQAA